MKCAVIGVGYLGQFHAQKYKNIKDIELVGVFDAHPETAQKVAQQLGVKAFASLPDLIQELKTSDLCGVTVAASTQAHYAIVETLLKNKIPVNVEKPMAATLEQSQALVKLANSQKVLLTVGHIERFNPSILDLRKHLQQPVFIELKRLGPFKARGADVSVLYDLLIHDLDLAFWLTQSEPDSWDVAGAKMVSSTWDTCLLNMKMKNGIRVNIEVSRVSPQTQRSIKVTQKESVLTAQTGSMEMSLIRKGPSLDKEPLLAQTWTVEKKDALQEETQTFVNAVRQQGPLSVTAQDGLRAMEWLHRFEKQLETQLDQSK